MERRVFIAVILSFVVLYGYQALFPPPEPPVTPKPAPQPLAAAAAPDAVAPGAAAATPPASEPAPAAQVGETAPREIVVDTAHARIVLSNVGARLLRWQLKGYTDATGAMVDLVPSDLPPEQPRPFSLAVPDAAMTRRLQSATYRVSGDTSGHVDAQTAAAGGGVRIRGRRRPCRQEDAAVRAAAACRAADGAGPIGPIAAQPHRDVGSRPRRHRRRRQAAAASSPATTFSRHRRSTSGTARWSVTPPTP